MGVEGRGWGSWLGVVRIEGRGQGSEVAVGGRGSGLGVEGWGQRFRD